VSLAKTQSAAAKTPASERLQRLAVDAGAYLGKDAGDTIPVKEVRLQAEANGYKPPDIMAMLEAEGLGHTQKIRVPQRGDIFGELWAEVPSGAPSPEPPLDKSLDIIGTFRDWLHGKADKDATNHAYSRRNANRVFARGKDVDRHFIKHFESFATVLITYCANVSEGESIAQHAEKFYPRAVVRKRRRLLRELDVYEQSAGISVLAPKIGERVPSPDAPEGYTHAHDFLWIPAEVSARKFYPLIRKHIEKVDGASEDNHTLNEAVKIQVHVSEDVHTPRSVHGRGSNMDAHRGVTTSLPQELGNNLPLLRSEFDARGLPEYAEDWCANLRLGTDEKLSTKGVARHRPLYRFNDVADAINWQRRFVICARAAATLM